MAQSQAELVKALVDAGVHFGHRVSRWNPKMEPYIHGKRNMIHIIDVKETIKGLLRAKKLMQQHRRQRQGRPVRRHQAPGAPRRRGRGQAAAACTTSRERWLGGTLTNFRTIRARLNRLEELEKLWDTGADRNATRRR